MQHAGRSRFKNGDSRKNFDAVVDRPLSTSAGVTASIRWHDPYDRFQPFGGPPAGRPSTIAKEILTA
jgi:hypothetical protein